MLLSLSIFRCLCLMVRVWACFLWESTLQTDTNIENIINGAIMMKLLQIDFEYYGPMGEDMSNALSDLAKSINQEPGLIWKIWTESESEKRGGGIYLFEDESSAKNYLEMHTARLKGMGVSKVRGIIFDVNQPLTAINHGPVGQ